MTKRVNLYAHVNLLQPFVDYSQAAAAESGLEPILKELVKIRASQINGCAMCLMLHTTEARRIGESEMRIYLLDGWREAQHFTPRERAAIAWTEALTKLDHAAMDEAYAMIEAEFNEQERVWLSMLIGIINVYNRLNIGFQVSPPRSAQIAVAA